jgi:hypothetical protein
VPIFTQSFRKNCLTAAMASQISNSEYEGTEE